MLHFLEVVQVIHTTLKVLFHWCVMVRSNIRSESRIALECDLKSGSKNSSGRCSSRSGHLTCQSCALRCPPEQLKMSFAVRSERDPRRGAAAGGVPPQRDQLLHPPTRPLHPLQVLRGRQDRGGTGRMAHGGVALLHHRK